MIFFVFLHLDIFQIFSDPVRTVKQTPFITFPHKNGADSLAENVLDLDCNNALMQRLCTPSSPWRCNSVRQVSKSRRSAHGLRHAKSGNASGDVRHDVGRMDFATWQRRPVCFASRAWQWQWMAAYGSWLSWPSSARFSIATSPSDENFSDFRSVNPHKAMVTGWCEIALKWSYLRISPRGPWFSGASSIQEMNLKATANAQWIRHSCGTFSTRCVKSFSWLTYTWNNQRWLKRREKACEHWRWRRLWSLHFHIFHLAEFTFNVASECNHVTQHTDTSKVAACCCKGDNTLFQHVERGVTAVSHQHLRWHFDVARGKVHLQNCEQSWRRSFWVSEWKKTNCYESCIELLYSISALNSPELHK